MGPSGLLICCRLTKTRALERLDKLARLLAAVGHADAAARSDELSGAAKIATRERWRGSPRKGKRFAGLRVSPWRTDGGRGGLEGGRRRRGVVERSAASSEQLELDDRREEVGLGCCWARGGSVGLEASLVPFFIFFFFFF